MVVRRGTGAGKAGKITVQDHVLGLLAEMDQRYRSVLAEMDLRYQQRFDAQQRALDAAFLSAEKAVQAALIAAEKAVVKAETATERRIEGLNELRSIVNDISNLQMPRSEAEQRLTALSEKIGEVKETAGTQRDRGLGLNSGWIYLIGAVSVAGSVVSLIMALTR